MASHGGKEAGSFPSVRQDSVYSKMENAHMWRKCEARHPCAHVNIAKRGEVLISEVIGG